MAGLGGKAGEANSPRWRALRPALNSHRWRRDPECDYDYGHEHEHERGQS